MTKNNGFIALWRKLRENPIYTNSKAVHIWVECLMRATYKDRTIYQGREKVQLKAGQFLMGYEEFADTLELPTSTVYFWLGEFEDNDMVKIKSNTKGTIVTVENWEDYQELKNERKTNEKPEESEKKANEKREESNNKVNKGNNVNKKNNVSDSKSEDDPPKYPKDSKPYKFAFKLRNLIRENNEYTKLPDKSVEGLQDWADSIRKLNEYGESAEDDGKSFSYDKIDSLIEFSQEDEFWRQNILSAGKLRKQAGKLISKISGNGKDNNGGRPSQVTEADRKVAEKRKEWMDNE